MDRKLLCLFILCVTGWCRAQNAPQQPKVWTDFRQAYPFHAQLVALTQPDGEGHRTMILSEPPPKVTLDGLKKVLGPAALKLDSWKHPMGADGWVRDIVVELDALPEGGVQELVSAVHWYAFGTTYKASALMLPAGPVGERRRMDLSFTMSDLDDHILSSQETYSNSETALALTVSGLLQAKKPGVFYSSKPGAVIWIVPRNGDLSRAGKTIRRFVLDSDLILGAAASDTYVAIVARERAIPIECLPPLRAETILLLASAEGTQLAQSYERRYIYAGEIQRDVDWAPIYLSPELIDTEYGSLLNITDQLLKSWSESGKVTYARFHYPQPLIAFPFKDGLYDDAHVREVTYNWNTSGFGYVVKRGGLETFAVNRTGALPVSYISGSNSILRQKEERAYQFFASTSDPNLARVVQYGALYQIFRRYRITAPKGETATAERPSTSLIAGLAAKLNEALTIDPAAEQKRLIAEAPSDAAEIHQELVEFSKLQAELRAVRREPSGIEQLAECLAAGRFTYDCTLLSTKGSHVPAALELATSDDFFHQEMVRDEDRRQVMDALRDKNKQRDNGWIKTPSFVLSSNPGMEGGHNIGAKVFEFRTNPELKPGEVRISTEDGHSVISLSEADQVKSSSIVPSLRTVIENGTGATSRDIEMMLARANVTRHSRAEALGLPSEVPMGRRAYEARNTITRQTEAGYIMSGNTQDRMLAGSAAKLGPSFIVSRDSANSYRVIEPAHAAEAHTHDLEGVTELLADSYARGGTQVSPSRFGVYLNGVTPDDALAFKKTMEFRMEAQTGRKMEINAFLQKDGVLTEKSFSTLSSKEYDLTRAKISEPEISVVEEGAVRRTRVDYRLEFNAVEPARPTLLVRIRMFFAENVVRPSQQVLEAALGRALVKLQQWRGHAFDVDSRLAMLTIKSELKKVCPPDTDMHVELADLFLVEMERLKYDISFRKAG